MDNQIVVSDYAQMDRVLREERAYILNLVKQIKKAGCNVLLIQKSILRYVHTQAPALGGTAGTVWKTKAKHSHTWQSNSDCTFRKHQPCLYFEFDDILALYSEEFEPWELTPSLSFSGMLSVTWPSIF